MDSAEKDIFMMSVQVAAQIGADLFCGKISRKEHEDEIYSRMRRHDVPEEWFVRVRSLAYTFHSFAVFIAEHAPAHLEKKKPRKVSKKA